MAMLCTSGRGSRLGVRTTVLGIIAISRFIHLITDDRTRNGAQARTNQGAFPLMAGLVPDYSARTRAQRTAQKGAILCRRSIAARGYRRKSKDAQCHKSFHGNILLSWRVIAPWGANPAT